jgi:hypothetical protein
MRSIQLEATDASVGRRLCICHAARMRFVNCHAARMRSIQLEATDAGPPEGKPFDTPWSCRFRLDAAHFAQHDTAGWLRKRAA